MAAGRRSRVTKAAGVAALAMSLAACATTTVVRAVTPTGGVAITKDQSFGADPRQTLDVYAPKRPSPASRPVVVFLYGGSWQGGDKALYVFVGAALARRGFVTVIPNYRLYPQVRWPAFLEDNAKAVRWARDHARDYGGDPNDLFLMGHSAGAYNAAELTFDKRWLTAVGMDPARDLRGMVGMSGPYDFLPLRDEKLKVIFGPVEQRPDTQPINHVDGSAPPALFLQGLADKVVDPGNSPRMAARIRAAGGQAQVIDYPRVGHMSMMESFLAPLRFIAPALKDATAFLAAHASHPPQEVQP